MSVFDCAIIPANSASGRESVRRATLFVYFMMRAWGLKAMDAIGLDRPYEGAERAQMLYVVAEKVIETQDVIRKLRSKYMVDGDFEQKRNVIHRAAVSLSYKHVSLSVFPLFFFFLLKRRKKNNYDYFWGCRWV